MPRPSLILSYSKGAQPTIPGAESRYLQDELDKLERAIAAIASMTPQPATVAPRAPLDGMVRLARAPWRPLGGTVDLWVYWDATSGTWVAF